MTAPSVQRRAAAPTPIFAFLAPMDHHPSSILFTEPWTRTLPIPMLHSGEDSLLHCGFHPRIGGRPARFDAFRDILRLPDARRERIRTAGRAEIARAFIAAMPGTP